jgi:murein L,D-transpeptidase YafK
MKRFIVIALIILVAISFLYYLFPEDTLPPHVKIDKLVVLKSKRRMEAYSKGEVIKIYKISLGRSPIGDKEVEGDKKTPEGAYFINGKNSESGYYKNLGISYPNREDIEQARMKKINPGGEIKIHGIRNGFGFIGKFQRWLDWTAGCVALTNEEVDEIYQAVEVGTPITILP